MRYTRSVCDLSRNSPRGLRYRVLDCCEARLLRRVPEGRARGACRFSLRDHCLLVLIHQRPPCILYVTSCQLGVLQIFYLTL